MNRLKTRIDNLSRRYGTEAGAELTVVVEAPEGMPDHEIRSSVLGAESATAELIVLRQPKEQISEAREIQRYPGSIAEFLDHIARHGTALGSGRGTCAVPVNH